MDVPWWVWLATVGGLVLLFVVDLVIVDHKPHAVGIAEAARWVIFYLACAAVFGLGIWIFAGQNFVIEYFAGYLTEYSLSVDNLFIFVIIMTTFCVPAAHQHRVLLIGIIISLIMRGVFIAAGAALISRFSWVFYFFGALLIYLGWRQIRHRNETPEFQDNVLLRALRMMVPVTGEYDGARLTVKRDGKRFVTPMIVVMLAIGSVDLIFALDSIPAIFGLTKEPFIVFTANAFALMGLRQLYFLLGGLLDRIVYLSIGLGAILGFIGVKLVLDALHDNSLPFFNNGQPLPAVPEVGIELSLGVIVSMLLVTVVASLLKTRQAGKPKAQLAHPTGSEPEPGTVDGIDRPEQRTERTSESGPERTHRAPRAGRSW